MDERALILRARAGDKEAFSELVKACQAKVFLTACRLLRNEEEAQELTQDAFICAYQAIKGFRLRSSFYTWVYRIALNLCYHKLRSVKYKINSKAQGLKDSMVSSGLDPSQILALKEQSNLIHQALGSLKKRFYRVVVLADLEGLSYKEIAKIQDCSLGTVMSRLHRGRTQLAQKLKNLGIKLV